MRSTFSFCLLALFTVAAQASPELKVSQHMAIYEFSPSHSIELFNFLESSSKNNAADFQIEFSILKSVSTTKDCAKKETKVFGAPSDLKNISYTCRTPAGKYSGAEAKADFESSSAAPTTEVTTIHGKNIGCTHYSNPEKYVCGLLVLEDGTTESNAPWVMM